jgi:hypothetical protein
MRGLPGQVSPLARRLRLPQSTYGFPALESIPGTPATIAIKVIETGILIDANSTQSYST